MIMELVGESMEESSTDGMCSTFLPFPPLCTLMKCDEGGRKTRRNKEEKRSFISDKRPSIKKGEEDLAPLGAFDASFLHYFSLPTLSPPPSVLSARPWGCV